MTEVSRRTSGTVASRRTALSRKFITRLARSNEASVSSAARRHVNSAARARPRAASSSARPRSRRSRVTAAARSSRSLRVEEERCVAGDLGHGRSVRAGDGNASPHRLEHRQAEALPQRREDEACGGGVEPFEVGRADPPGKKQRFAYPERLRTGSQLLAERRWIGRHDRHGVRTPRVGSRGGPRRGRRRSCARAARRRPGRSGRSRGRGAIAAPARASVRRPTRSPARAGRRRSAPPAGRCPPRSRSAPPASGR